MAAVRWSQHRPHNSVVIVDTSLPAPLSAAAHADDKVAAGLYVHRYLSTAVGTCTAAFARCMLAGQTQVQGRAAAGPGNVCVYAWTNQGAPACHAAGHAELCSAIQLPTGLTQLHISTPLFHLFPAGAAGRVVPGRAWGAGRPPSAAGHGVGWRGQVPSEPHCVAARDGPYPARHGAVPLKGEQIVAAAVHWDCMPADC